MIFNMTGGGSGGAGGGATLVVSCPANVTVTVSKDDKSYTKNSGNLGSATFRGLTTGEWTVKIQSSSQTATKTITVTADYAITMAFFAAYINVTYPAGSTCGITTDHSGLSDVIYAGDTSGHWSFTVPYAGTWYVASYIGDISNPDKITLKTVNITTDGQSESVTLKYELVLYRLGDENTAVTGGWTGKPCYPWSGNTSWVITPTITRNSENIQFYIASNKGGGITYPTNNVDLTDYKTLTLRCNTGTIQEGWFCVWKDRPPNNGEGFDYNRAINFALASNNTYEQTYDISSLTGVYSMGFGLFSNQNETNIYLTELVAT